MKGDRSFHLCTISNLRLSANHYFIYVYRLIKSTNSLGQSYDNLKENVIWALGVDNGVNDSNVAPKLSRHGNFNYVADSVISDPTISNHDLPAFLYLSQAPNWWYVETPLPPIGPDVAGLVNKIPAERRFEGLPCLLKKALTFAGIPRDKAISRMWKVNVTFSNLTSWRIDYIPLPSIQPSLLIVLPVSTHQFTLTGLTNYTSYKISLTTDSPGLPYTICYDADRSFQLPVEIEEIR